MDENTRIAIIGGTGMLGRSIIEACERRQVQVVRTTRQSGNNRDFALVDISLPDSVDFFMKSWEPDVVINAAAYTAVDDAEADYHACFQTNAMGPKHLARACKTYGASLVHVSTDYVFGGAGDDRRSPFQENEVCMPCGIYGWSKYVGEEAVQQCLPGASLVVRTSWLHGAHGKNFIDTIARLAQEKDELRVVNDQTGSLTHTDWLAEVLLELVEKKVTGILHACARDEVTWFDVAEMIVSHVNASCKIAPQSTAESNRPAPRPEFSKLSTTALERVLDRPVPSSRDFVRAHLSH